MPPSFFRSFKDLGFRLIKNAIILAILIAVVALLVGISYAFFHRNAFWALLTEKIRAGQSIVYFHEITDFSWDTVCVLAPYSLGSHHSREGRIKEYIKGDLGALRNRLPNLNDDASWAFVFIKNNQVIKITQKGRRFFLYKDYEDNCLNKEDASFFFDGDKLLIRAAQTGERP